MWYNNSVLKQNTNSIKGHLKHFLFAILIGTATTFTLFRLYEKIFEVGSTQTPFGMAFIVLCVAFVWTFLFGPWRPQVKATVLGTCIFWIAYQRLSGEAPEERNAHMLAALIAFIPAVIWCVLFLKEHKQRLSLVILMFFAGMLSTAPILFYDALVRNQIELQFFLFRIVPENFSRSSSAFVSGNLVSFSGMKSTLAVTFISFLIVGLIEEVSKFWVLKKSGQHFFSSIDDVLQLGIIVAIGFAFAENVMNPTYFLAFVRNFLINAETPQWGSFLGNVVGRAILTNMVHILSTGVLAYFYALTLFADPILEEEHRAGKVHVLPHTLLALLRIPEEKTYNIEKMTLGLLLSIVLHGMFNFLVTLPEILPGNPRTLGDVFGLADGNPLHYIALLIVPSLFYVVGGFWILSILFYSKQNMQERGVLIETDSFVPEDQFFARYAK